MRTEVEGKPEVVECVPLMRDFDVTVNIPDADLSLPPLVDWEAVSCLRLPAVEYDLSCGVVHVLLHRFSSFLSFGQRPRIRFKSSCEAGPLCWYPLGFYGGGT